MINYFGCKDKLYFERFIKLSNKYFQNYFYYDRSHNLKHLI